MVTLSTTPVKIFDVKISCTYAHKPRFRCPARICKILVAIDEDGSADDEDEDERVGVLTRWQCWSVLGDARW